MIETFQVWYQQFMVFANQNQIVAGAVSLWGLAVASFLLRNVPTTIWLWVKRNMVTSVTLNNTDWEKQIMMANFLGWYQQQNYVRFSRTFSYTPRYDNRCFAEGDETPIVSAGYGIHFFFFKGRFMWMNLSKLDSSGSERQKEEITISLLGRTSKPFKKLAEEFTPKPKPTRHIMEYNMSEHAWVPVKTMISKDLDTVALNPNIRSFVTETIPKFLESRDWYVERGLAYKLTTILHGKAGTGKTSLLRAVASYYNRHICTLNLTKLSDDSFQTALNVLPKNAILIIEDFDSASATKNRVQKVESGNTDNDAFEVLTLSGMLNALDGVAMLDDAIIFLTTNHLEHIDSALYRKGRVDHVLAVNELEPEVVENFSKRIFPDYEFPEGLFSKPLIGCHLHAAIVYAMDNPELYVDYLSDVWDNDRHLESN